MRPNVSRVVALLVAGGVAGVVTLAVCAPAPEGRVGEGTPPPAVVPAEAARRVPAPEEPAIGDAVGDGTVGLEGIGGLIGASGGGVAEGLGGLGLRGVGSGGGGGSYGSGAPMLFEGVHVSNAGWVTGAEDAVSTFAIDVDTGSYTLTRRLLGTGVLPPAHAVRVEEFVNYLPYRYAQPDDDAPLAVNAEAAPHPWHEDRVLLRVGLQAPPSPEQRPPVHLVFLVDVSGSMTPQDRLPLARAALHGLVDQLGDEDTIALVTYAGASRVVLPPTPTTRRADIHDAIDELTPGGSTAMGSGIALAYGLAAETRAPGVENRVVLLSDGDVNVGAASHTELLALIDEQRRLGVTLSTVGFGTTRYNDRLMEQLADRGDGNYAYVDSLAEARRVFGERLAGTVYTVARDVRVQVEFDDAVRSWRLVGYENRDIPDASFADDRVDGGELGSGHAVTAVYELVLDGAPGGDLATVRIRAKPPGEDAPSREWTTPIGRDVVRASLAEASADFRMAWAAAAFAEKLRSSAYLGDVSFADIVQWAWRARRPGVAEDAELLALMHQARRIAGEERPASTASR